MRLKERAAEALREHAERKAIADRMVRPGQTRTRATTAQIIGHQTRSRRGICLDCGWPIAECDCPVPPLHHLHD